MNQELLDRFHEAQREISFFYPKIDTNGDISILNWNFIEKHLDRKFDEDERQELESKLHEFAESAAINVFEEFFGLDDGEEIYQ